MNNRHPPASPLSLSMLYIPPPSPFYCKKNIKALFISISMFISIPLLQLIAYEYSNRIEKRKGKNYKLIIRNKQRSIYRMELCPEICNAHYQVGEGNIEWS